MNWLNITNFLIFFLDEKNPKLIDIYKQKMSEYFERAEYLKKGVLSKNGNDDTVNAGGGSGQASKKKYEFWSSPYVIMSNKICA